MVAFTAGALAFSLVVGREMGHVSAGRAQRTATARESRAAMDGSGVAGGRIDVLLGQPVPELQLGLGWSAG